MTFEITINQTLLTYLGILIIWFILPSVLDIKTHMADKKRNLLVGAYSNSTLLFSYLL